MHSPGDTGRTTMTTTKNPAYRLKRDRFEHKAGTTVYRTHYSDYGTASGDTRMTGVEHVSVTLNQNGEYPFFTVPVADLEPIPAVPAAADVLPEASPATKGQCNDERACGACFSGQGQCETAAPAVHPDDAAVDALAAAMKAKMARQRAKGYGGWDTDCTQQRLSDLLRGHVDKGDPVDVANFCAFLLARGEGIAPPVAKNLTAPSVTPADVEAQITHTFYANLGDAENAAWPDPNARDEFHPALNMITTCTLVTKNGHSVVGVAYCADPAKFNAQTGRDSARADAIRQLWPMVIYAERERLAARNMTTADAMAVLKAAIKADPEYAWSWHCAIWSGAHDEGLETGAANRAAARVMHMAFDCDTSKNANFSAALPVPAPDLRPTASDDDF